VKVHPFLQQICFFSIDEVRALLTTISAQEYSREREWLLEPVLDLYFPDTSLERSDRLEATFFSVWLQVVWIYPLNNQS
jgi:hypothetical protein